MNNSPKINIINVQGHWEIRDQAGNFIVSGDTRDEAVASYEEMRYDLESEDDEEEKDIDEDVGIGPYSPITGYCRFCDTSVPEGRTVCNKCLRDIVHPELDG